MGFVSTEENHTNCYFVFHFQELSVNLLCVLEAAKEEEVKSMDSEV